MKNNNTDSTANLSRFARDKRQRVSSAERVERSPRPRREADNEGERAFRPRVANTLHRYAPEGTATRQEPP
ncbi:MAG: pseudouridine synthase, partial [Alistipes sp.]|nr:pseudouridine synthase [Alistipes sp.]